MVASPTLRAPEFLRTVVALLEHNDEGALGVVVNRPTEACLSGVLPGIADLGTAPAVVFSGGPVEPNAAIALGFAVPESSPEGWREVVLPWVTVDLDHDPALLAATLRRLRVFAGYAGWSGGQLEAEVAAGAWYVVESLPDDPFHSAPDQLWAAVLRRQPWPLSVVATCPVDPTIN